MFHRPRAVRRILFFALGVSTRWDELASPRAGLER